MYSLGDIDTGAAAGGREVVADDVHLPASSAPLARALVGLRRLPAALVDGMVSGRWDANITHGLVLACMVLAVVVVVAQVAIRVMGPR